PARFSREETGTGGPDFEAPTRVVHCSRPRLSVAGERVASAPATLGRGRPKTNGPGDAWLAKVRHGGTPQHDGLGSRLPLGSMNNRSVSLSEPERQRGALQSAAWESATSLAGARALTRHGNR